MDHFWAFRDGQRPLWITSDGQIPTRIPTLLSGELSGKRRCAGTSGNPDKYRRCVTVLSVGIEPTRGALEPRLGSNTTRERSQ